MLWKICSCRCVLLLLFFTVALLSNLRSISGFQTHPSSFHKKSATKETSIWLDMSSSSSVDDGRDKVQNPNKRVLYPFKEARKIARGHGFDSKEEFLEYSCPGAYQLPKNPDEVWKDDWKGWEDWLGICHTFEDGRLIARGLGIKTEEEYLQLFKEKKIEDDDPASRLPYRPDLKYKSKWNGWDDWLGVN